jgi:Secretion system C-terminal sorting domain
MKRTLLVISAVVCALSSFAQCITTNIPGNYTQSSDIILSGVINVTGTYTLPAGVTITVPSYSIDNCGSLTINASKIVIQGNIIADYSGYTGGSGGAGATSVTSITGHENGLTGCVDKDNAGQITVGGGQAGLIGNGTGAGSPGGNGTVGSGTKQVCANLGDEAGLIGGSGGAGGGGGGSYGGAGTTGSSGGGGSSTGSISGASYSNAYTPIGGIGGMGGNSGSTYGTSAGADIDLGSGGAGAGGGGRSFYVGENGGQGGDGGGMIKLVATDTLIITGTLSANGEDGGAGGKGGNGDKTADCCSDACNDCAERTITAGAGGGSGGGAGSGGGIFIQSDHILTITGTLSVNGGDGGVNGVKGNGASCSYSDFFCGDEDMSTTDGSDGGTGGSGGGGRIKIFTNNCPSNVITPTHTELGGTGASAGTYQVIVVGCPDFVGVDNFEGTLSAQVYPNPATNFVNVQIDAFSVGMNDVNVLVYDATGRVLYQTNSKLEKGQIIQVPVDQLAAGIYSIVLMNNNANVTYKFVKQ